jgi:hypothetical protein
MEIDFNQKITNAIKKYHEYGVKYAEAKALAWHLEEARKSVLSAEMLKFPDGTSVAEREMRARASEVYLQHLEGTKEAIREEATWRVKMDCWKYEIEKLRSLCSQETSRIRAIGGTDADVE